MDEDNLSAFFLDVLLHLVVEHLELIFKDGFAIHALLGFEKGRGVKVHLNDTVAHGVSRRLHLRALLAFGFYDGVAELLGVDKHRAGGLVIFHDIHNVRRLLEEEAFAEGVEFVKLRTVKTEAHIYGRFGQEGFLLLISNSLEREFLEFGKDAAVKFFEEEFRVGFNHPTVAHMTGTVRLRQQSEAQRIVTIVDEIHFKCRIAQLLNIHGRKTKTDIQQVAPTSLHGFRLKGHGAKEMGFIIFHFPFTIHL